VASQSTRAWIDGLSASAVCNAVRAVLPDLADAPVELHVELEQIDPIWHRGTAWLGHTHVVKFAWSAEAALELARERIAMLALGGTRFARWMPTVEATSERPLLIVTRRVEGVPCWGEILSDPNIARDVATALADLHDPRVLSAIRNGGIEPPAPSPQADTEAIRSRLHRFLSPSHLSLVRRWCDWTDRVQASSTGKPVILHGDLHGYNLLVRDGSLRCVLDYDAISVGDHHYDLRYLPGLGSSIDFLVAVVDEYERRTGRAVDPAPLLAWHIRTVLGDALWRSEAGVPLPAGGTVHDWIEALELRIARLAVWRAFDRP
jgi:aminoglycoside phosphotransferase (APT) family kinase protein